MTGSCRSFETNGPFDFVGGINATRPSVAYMRHFTKSSTSPYFSPWQPSSPDSRYTHLTKSKGSGLNYDTKIYIQVGTAECLYDEGRFFARDMKDAGVDVRFREIVGGTHVPCVIGLTKGDAMKVTKKDLEDFVLGM